WGAGAARTGDPSSDWGWDPPKSPDTPMSPSPDKTIIMWKLTRDETNYGIPQSDPREVWVIPGF
uniref:Uncharacterized protein n=1 Tax=Catharus ustulatus TaxID=91951 RepID=A0A8C3UH49_CATUS